MKLIRSGIGLLVTIAAAFVAGLILAWPLWWIATRTRLYTPLLIGAIGAILVVPIVRRRGRLRDPSNLR